MSQQPQPRPTTNLGAPAPAPSNSLLPPAPKSNRRLYFVLACGIASTIFALVLVYLLQNNADTNPMGWYADYIIPAGAVFIGLIASSGYGAAAWKTGLKIRGGLLALIVVLQIGAYFTAQYSEFALRGPFVDPDTKRVLSFPEYYHRLTVNIAWEENGKPGEALGGLGYALRLGEILGFVAGTLVVPVVLRKKPYCERCERYMQTRLLAVLPASNVKAGHLFGKKAIPMTSEQVMEAGMTDMVELVSLATAGDAAALTGKITVLQAQRKQAQKLSKRIVVNLVNCRQCADGRLEIQLAETKGRAVTQSKLGETAIGPEVVRDLQQKSFA